MLKTPLAIALSALLIGCAESGSTTSNSDPFEPKEPFTANVEPPVELPTEENVLWAFNLLKQADAWDVVTTEPDPSDPGIYTDCRAPDPNEWHTPHNRMPKRPDSTPANHVVVNPKGRHYFYEKTDELRPVVIDKPFPAGTVIIKEKYDDIEDAKQRKKPTAFGAMIKQEPGYDPEHGDWEYAYITVNEKRTITSVSRGKINGCADCHANRSNADYVYRTYPLVKLPK